MLELFIHLVIIKGQSQSVVPTVHAFELVDSVL